jgi:ABC-2 type transport system ATP-binding protein
MRHLSPDPATYDQQRGTLTLPATDGVATLREALRALDAAAITPSDVDLRKPTLDDVFLALTGRGRAER